MATTNQSDANFRQILETALTQPGAIHAAYSAFHGYSLGNQLLAYVQCVMRDMPIGPIATFNGWKDKGRFVKKGQKALQLCMPVTCKRTEKDATTGDETTHTFTRFVFRNNWFVLAQTDGAELPVATTPEWEATRALAALNVTEVPFDSMNGNCQGFARERSIAVSPIAALPFKTRFHELAHVVLGHTTEAESGLTDDEQTPRSLREVEAESVALLCCEALNLPGAEYSRGYIQHWNEARGAEAIPERSAQRIFKAADQILRAGRLIEEKTTDAYLHQ